MHINQFLVFICYPAYDCSNSSFS
uniref:Uncharacterized protein n=1 Tax=Arundo donax TaxID=35708 RepID=A0A0A9B9E7_ARUDO